MRRHYPDLAADHFPSRHSRMSQAGVQKIRNDWMPASAPQASTQARACPCLCQTGHFTSFERFRSCAS